MKKNSMQLEHFGTVVDNDDSFQETLAIIQNAQAASTISSLSLINATKVGAVLLGKSLTDFCFSLKYLTRLEIWCNYSDSAPILLIDILQTRTMLESLKFKQMAIDEWMNDELFYSKLSNIYIGRLEQICLQEFDIHDSDDASMNEFNMIVKFILRSCPNLKNIVLNADEIYARGEMNLDFRENLFLYHIKLNMPDCRYYTFQHEFGRYWRGADEEIKRDTNLTRKQEKKNYHSL